MNQLIIGALDLSRWFDAAGSIWQPTGNFNLKLLISTPWEYLEPLRLIRYKAVPLYCFYRSDFAFVHRITYIESFGFALKKSYEFRESDNPYSGIFIEGSYHDAIPF